MKKRFNFYKVTTLVLLLALIATVALSTTGVVSAHGRGGCHGIPASSICVTVDGQQISLQEAFNQLKVNIDATQCRINYLGVGMGGALETQIAQLQGAFTYLFPSQQFNFNPPPTPPSPSELGTWCEQNPD
jgi:hypothetical protein